MLRTNTFNFKLLFHNRQILMDPKFHQCVILIFFISSISLSYSQSNSPQNIQTFYPFFPISIARPQPNSQSPIPTRPQQQPPLSIHLNSKSSSKKAITIAVVATALSTLLISGLFFLLLNTCKPHRRERKVEPNPYADNTVVPRGGFTCLDGNFKGVIVDEHGLDVIYWRTKEGGEIKRNFNREEFNITKNQEGEKSISPPPKGIPSHGTQQGQGDDDDFMVSLFGSVATNRKSPRGKIDSSNPNTGKSNPLSYYITIIDPLKSQNIAIILRSLAISRQEIIDALTDGRGLNKDTLQKFTGMTPTEEEELEILSFDGNPMRLADAESFLFHLLNSFPSSFTRFNAMLLRSNYESEIYHLKQSIKTLELGCNELRTQGTFLKLLEAILKAGNSSLNVLEASRKISHVKSPDGKSTLLHLVIQQLVWSEGKRCLITRSSENYSENEERESEYMMLGLQVIRGLSLELTNVKKASKIDYDAFEKLKSSITTYVAEIRPLVVQCGTSEGGFSRGMENFLDEAEEKIKIMEEEEKRVMEIVDRTTEFYQLGGSEDKGTNQFQLFSLVIDLLGMADKVCLDIERNLEKKRTETIEGVGSSSSSTPVI